MKKNSFMLLEVANGKIYRQYLENDENLPLRSIYRFNNELYAFEKLEQAESFPYPLVLEQQVEKVKLKPFKTVRDIERGSNLEAQDKYHKWYVGIVTDKKTD